MCFSEEKPTLFFDAAGRSNTKRANCVIARICSYCGEKLGLPLHH